MNTRYNFLIILGIIIPTVMISAYWMYVAAPAVAVTLATRKYLKSRK